MAADPFTERLARVRERFASALESRIEDTYAALPDLAGETAVFDAVDQTYRRIHGIVGIGPTVGFTETGRAAQTLERILLPPHAGARGLTAAEFTSFQQALHDLRETAASELESFHSSRG